MSSDAAVRPLAGLEVVDLSSWIAGAYCSRLLADAGAAVTRVEPDGGHPLRTWSASGESAGALHRHLTDGLAERPADELDDVLATAGACVWSPGAALDPLAIRTAHPHLTVVAISPFGLDTPWSDRPATEFTLQAWSGGIIGLGRGAADLPPVHVGGQVGEWLAGAYAAVGLLAALRDGGGELVDVSMLEVQAMCLTYYPVTFHDSFGRPMRKRRALTVPGVAAASDGLVGLGVGTGQQWLDFCVMAGHPEWAEDASLFTERGALAGQIDEWVGGQTVAEVLDTASAFRIPNAPIVDGANAPTIEHLREREVFRTAEDGTVRPRPPFRITTPTGAGPAPTPRSAPAPRSVPGTWGVRPGPREQNGRGSPFRGLRVLDMTAYWAGPSASHLLALLGAEVVHLESARRPDGARLVGGRSQDLDRYWEQGPIFAALNTNKKSLTLDFAKPEGLDLLRRFIATCDVVIENFTPRVLDQLGFTYESLRELRDDLIVVRMPGFGLDGPWRDNAAFAFVIEDASGLTWMTGHPEQHPVEPYCTGDSNAGLHAAYGLLLALAQRDATGTGCQVEAAMVDAALSITAEQVVEHSTSGVRLARDGNRGPAAAPQNLYECADADEYGREPARVAVAVATDEQWTALRGALGDPDWAADPSLDDHAGRRAAHDLIDDRLREWCASRTADEVIGALWSAGVPVGRVLQPHRQPELPPLQARGFFEELDHPVMGPARYSTIPFRLGGRPEALHRRHAPLLGEHTAELLGELGLGPAELAQLEADGVIATALEGAA
ncbi:CaiB/BaiF CoA-transferase family protein [Dermatobacter hominis]|uniref:CaiB/BaiF CoA-transferase family protein n=1 Tax=Dermatobacter hominis TaxID=2884263 RepID=UPI001D11E7FC|nr:CoA transferase [Dermatobacter hominis]UDY36715.1 CoA transferase [Dermatobacter hominis]